MSRTKFADECRIWGEPARWLQLDSPGIVMESPRAGGHYRVNVSDTEIANLSIEKKLLLTTWIVDQNRLGGVPPLVDPALLRDALPNMRKLGVTERRNRLLMYLARQRPRLGQGIEIRDTEHQRQTFQEMLAWTESSELLEIIFLIKFSMDQGLVAEALADPKQIMLTPAGFDLLDGFDRGTGYQGFIAMWFDPAMMGVTEKGFERAIADAGYKPMRIDRKEHSNKIDDEIIAEIRRSRFVVADFTSEPEKPRGGVYYEAGFAQGLGIPVIWTCRSDAINYVHFDTRQYAHILWTDANDLYEKLKKRIAAVIGDGPLKHQP